jgi:4-amino-4-deoxy-L-arabinose transferase-like glycosyltransferase
MASPASPALFDQFARGWRGYVLIALIALTSGLLGAASVPVTDIDEARFAQATRQMVEDDQYVRIRVQDAERNRKPLGIYWLQAVSVNAMQPFTERLNTIWPYRLPSALGLMLASLATLWAGTILFGPRTGFVGAAIFAVGMLASAEGMLAKTDAVMTGFTTLALACVVQLRAGTTRPRLVVLLFWAAIGCGILVKGPVTPLVAGLTLATLAIWERRAAWMKPLWFWPGPALALAISLPWFIVIGIATDGSLLCGHVAARDRAQTHLRRRSPAWRRAGLLSVVAAAADLSRDIRLAGGSASQAGAPSARRATMTQTPRSASHRLGGVGVCLLRTPANETPSLHAAGLPGDRADVRRGIVRNARQTLAHHPSCGTGSLRRVWRT